jgi:hypothetical protein
MLAYSFWGIFYPLCIAGHKFGCKRLAEMEFHKIDSGTEIKK